MTKQPFQASAWEADEYIISSQRPDDKPWEDRPVGMTLTKQAAQAVSMWLNFRVHPNELRRCADLLDIWLKERK